MPNDLYYSIVVGPRGSSYDLSSDISSLVVDEMSGKPDQLTIQMGDPFNLFSHALQVGMDVEVDLGSVQDHSILFRGQIYKVDGEFPKNGVPSLRILAYDRSMKLGLQKRNRLLTDKTLKDIVDEICQSVFSKVKNEVNSSAPKFGRDGVRQRNETDLAFLHRLADTYGYEMFVSSEEEEDELNFISKKSVITRESTVSLYYNRLGVSGRLISFQPSCDVAQMELPHVYSGIDYDEGKPTDVLQSPEPEPVGQEDPYLDENMTQFAEKHPDRSMELSQLIDAAPASKDTWQKGLGVSTVSVPGFISQEELKALASNQYSFSSQGMRAKGIAAGNHRLHAQLAAAIYGVGGTFSTKWFITQVRHTLNAQGYLSEFQCQR